MKRRLFNKIAIGSPLLLLGACSSVGDAKHLRINSSSQYYFSAGLLKNNKFYIYVQNQLGGEYIIKEVPFQVHSIVQDPFRKGVLIAIEKRGPHFLVLNFVTNKILQLYKLPEGREFVGHGIVNIDSRDLIITTRKVTVAIYHRRMKYAYDSGHVYSGIYNNGLLSFFKLEENQWVRKKELYSGGAEPHQLVLSVDKKTYWVANGIDYVDETLNSRLACLSHFEAKTNKLIKSYDYDYSSKDFLSDLGHLSISKNNNILLGSYVIPKKKYQEGGRMVSFSIKDGFKVFEGKNMPKKDEAFNIFYIKKEDMFLAVCPGESKLFSLNAKTLKVLKVLQLSSAEEPGGIVSTSKIGEYLFLTNKSGKIINSNLEILKEFNMPNHYFPGPHLELLIV